MKCGHSLFRLKSTEQWLGEIEKKLDYTKWYCGHYHTTKQIDKIQFMFEDFDEFPQKEDDFRENYDWCYKCGGYGNDFRLDENGELVCNCPDCPMNPDNDDI